MLVGVIFELAVSAVLSYAVIQQSHTTTRLAHVDQAAHCWDKVLDQAILKNVDRTRLTVEANHCATFIP